jgi:ABC-type Zn uptake system ZnuABC Zn-binding protein ZnuA
VAAQAVAPLETPSQGTIVTRALGDVHAQGNPHFNVDPLEGLRVAELICQRLSEIRPARADNFQANYGRLRRTVGERLVGPALNDKYDGTRLALLAGRGKLREFLDQQGDTAKLSGWLGMMQPNQGRKIVDDHPIWPYFARTFGLEVAAHMEPKPGVPPTTSHLKTVIELMQAEHIEVVVQAAYYDDRHARIVADATGARVAKLAHQAGALPGTDDWVEMIDYNVRTVAQAFARSGSTPL